LKTGLLDWLSFLDGTNLVEIIIWNLSLESAVLIYAPDFFFAAKNLFILLATYRPSFFVFGLILRKG